LIKYHDKRFPGESDAYRAARNALLAAEVALRKQIEAVSEFRRKLPLGGELTEDYIFEEGAKDLSDRTTVKQSRLSELFASGKRSLVIYSFMYPPDAESPCPMCTCILDSLNGTALHANDRINFVVVAKASIEKIRDWGRSRSWTNLRLLSSGGNSYNAEYFGENENKDQIPAINVFWKADDRIYHTYNAELFYAPSEPGQHPRHADLLWPLWNLFDLTPEGRGEGWLPKYSY
jgi:predicted dithiol-disulfide oxidoreductase (DUF899 family)